MEPLEVNPKYETNQTTSLQTMLWAGTLNALNPQTYNYYDPFKWSTLHTMVPSLKYSTNISQTNSSTHPTDQPAS